MVNKQQKIFINNYVKDSFYDKTNEKLYIMTEDSIYKLDQNLVYLTQIKL